MYGNIYVPAPSNTTPAYAPQQQGGGMDYSTGYGGGIGQQQHQQHQQQYLGGAPPQQQQQPQQYQYSAPPEQQHQQQYQYHQQQQQQAMQQQPLQGATLLDAATAPAGPPAPSQAASPWQVHYTADNRPYYFNVETQITQWEAPAA
jgi:hypothetical protein